jgi:hypothetical protein
MGIQDNKTLSLNISGRQIVWIVATFALCAIAIYANALTIGYVVVTIALCAFFLAVGFDYGVNPSQQPSGPEPEPGEPVSTGTPSKPNSRRSARTA